MDYLSRLPESLRRQGDASHGEIELLPATDDQQNLVGIVYEDDYLMVVQDPVKFPSGRVSTYGRVVEQASLHGNCGTVMVPIMQGHVVFLNIFRHATRQWEWELPRGFQEPGISAEENARKELREELGIDPESLVHVGLVKPNTGLLSGEAVVFVAHLPNRSDALATHDIDEGVGRIRLVEMGQLDVFLCDHVTCGFSLSAILLARLHKQI